ncbi:hypothetical protein GCM10010306_020400 [Streptomyces umbrinus]|uniref:DUF6578 domain-containing protein n=1 Tax=Streptomyces umbrinus TaxID=67370 RepID=UPI001678AF36|nr:DUF6578 domain-containing protein [Streptomyces umbrinus]GHB26880.1 hypothetical protein GCM10010306_020400 [Streptomyces umbrinus]
MRSWQVFYAGWQAQCCGTAFSVGDEVAWPLLLTDADELLGGGWYEELSKVVGPVERVRDEDGDTIDVIRSDQGLLVALPDDRVDGSLRDEGGWIRRVGMLTVEWHGGEWPVTAGTVRAIRPVDQRYVPAAPGSRTREPVPGERSLRSAGTWLKWGEMTENRTPADLAETGALVTIDIPGATPQEPRDPC